MSTKYTCGETLPSGCVLYTGDFPTFIDSEALQCIPNLDGILEAHAGKIEQLLSDSDLTILDKKCLDFAPATITIKGLHQVQINKLCDLEDRLSTLETSFSSLSVGSKLVTIDLDCLTPVASPCAQGTNTYTLLSILQIFKAEICQIKASLNL